MLYIFAILVVLKIIIYYAFKLEQTLYPVGKCDVFPT